MTEEELTQTAMSVARELIPFVFLWFVFYCVFSVFVQSSFTAAIYQ